MQIVHVNKSGGRLIVSVMFSSEYNAKSCFLDTLNINDIGGGISNLNVPISNLVENMNQNFYYYQGKTTDGQCNEAAWVIMRDVQGMSTAQSTAFKTVAATGFTALLNQGNNLQTVSLSGNKVYLSNVGAGEAFGLVINGTALLFTMLFSFYLSYPT
jgi:carbonic anhydrase